MNGMSQFWWRKLHSLSGGLLGIFLVGHLVRPGANPLGWGFLGTLLLFALPLLFHAGYGGLLVYETAWPRYGHLSNQRYRWQRLSAIAIAVFLVLHVVIMNLLPAWIHHPLYIVMWIVGALITLFHLCNGLASMLIHWGCTIGYRSQRVALIVMLILFLVLTLRALVGISELTGTLSFLQPLRRLFYS